MSIVPVTLLTVASAASGAPLAPAASSPSSNSNSNSILVLSDKNSVSSTRLGSEMGFIGTEVDGQGGGGVHGIASSDGVASGVISAGGGGIQGTATGIQSGLPNPYADIFPGSISTNPSNPKNPYTYTNSTNSTNPSTSPNASSQGPSSAATSILCVALVFTAVLIMVGIWQFQERRLARKWGVEQAGLPGQLSSGSSSDLHGDRDVEKGGVREAFAGMGGGDIIGEENIVNEKSTADEKNEVVGGGGGLENNFVNEGFLGLGDFAGKHHVLGMNGKMVRLGNQVVVTAVVGERVLRIL